MAIRFERDGAVGNIVLANPPLTESICALRRNCGSQCIRRAKATYVCGVRRVRDRPALRGQFGEVRAE